MSATVLLQQVANELPPGVSWAIIIVLTSALVWFLNRVVNRMEKTFDNLQADARKSIDSINSTMNQISKDLIKLEGRVSNLEKPKGRR
jgi:hypothetical protein